nr:DUF6125 family protein [Candidatus Sigynarchaeota archaeon]
MKALSKDDRLFYYEKNYYTLDGLWILETEKATDFDTALKIDLAVWKELLKIIYRRIKDYLKIEGKTVAEVMDLLAFRWACEKWDFTIDVASPDKGKATIKKCPYKEIMDRNPARKDIIPRICTDICIPIYKEAIASINPAIRVKRSNFMGKGSPICDFELSM